MVTKCETAVVKTGPAEMSEAAGMKALGVTEAHAAMTHAAAKSATVTAAATATMCGNIGGSAECECGDRRQCNFYLAHHDALSFDLERHFEPTDILTRAAEIRL